MPGYHAARSFISKNQARLVSWWAVKRARLYTGLRWFTPEGSQAGSDVDSPEGEHPKEVCCQRPRTPRSRLCRWTARTRWATRGRAFLVWAERGKPARVYRVQCGWLAAGEEDSCQECCPCGNSPLLAASNLLAFAPAELSPTQAGTAPEGRSPGSNTASREFNVRGQCRCVKRFPWHFTDLRMASGSFRLTLSVFT